MKHVKITSGSPLLQGSAAAGSSAALDGAHHLRHHRFVQTKCSQCGAAMACQPEGGCWCAELPPVPMPADAKGCLCPDCLRAKIAALQMPGLKKEA